MTYRTGGRETWHRLRDWDKGQADAERLAARVLPQDGFTDIDPAHPLGGPDGGTDVVCKREGKEWRVCVYFPRGQKSLAAIKGKYEEDAGKVKALVPAPVGIIFFTNQELTLSEREEVAAIANPLSAEVYHLERVATMLDTPSCYGFRLEFLAIEMNREEQVSFFNSTNEQIAKLETGIAFLVNQASEPNKPAPSPPMALAYVAAANSIYSTALGQKYVECSSCHEIFTAVDPTPRFSALSYLDDMRIVTCPYCKKTQKLK